jgi:hypothetical protein
MAPKFALDCTGLSQLEQEVPTPSELDAMNFRDMVRLGHERGLVREPET